MDEANFLAAYAAANLVDRDRDRAAVFLAAYAAANITNWLTDKQNKFLSCLRGSERGWHG